MENENTGHARPPILSPGVFQVVAQGAEAHPCCLITMSAFRPEADVELKCV